MSKRKPLPTKECQYKKDCYRKKPDHFESYSHKHIEAIVQKGKQNGKFIIPAEFDFNMEYVQAQCEIVEQLFPHLVSDQLAKRQTIDLKEAMASSSDIVVVDETDVFESTSSTQIPSKLNPNASEFNPSPEQQNSASACSSRDASANSAKPVVDDKIQEERKTKRAIARNIHEYFDVVPPKGKMAGKLEKAAPYNFFLTTITASKPTHTEPLSVTFMELLDDSLGELESSVQINFMVDIGWLMANYYFAGHEDKPLLILYGDETEDLKTISKTKPNVSTIKIDMGGNPYSVHHSKISILCYKDGSSRIVISTANLYVDDWHNRTQGLWISPKLTPMSEDSDTSAGDSITGFKEDFLKYLSCYKIGKLLPLTNRLRKTDFSSINVFFVASVPGGHREIPNKGQPWGHPRVGYLLGKHSAPVDEASPIVAQSSSIGSLGPDINAFIGSEWINSFRKDSAPLGIRRLPKFKMVYPSYNNVKQSHDNLLGGGCLPYRRALNEKQPWLKQYLHQWKAKSLNRNQAMPHIKTYCRWTDRGLYWFLLTSANLSKAAWGVFNKSSKIEPTIRINNYEAGVLFLPKFVLADKQLKYFPLGEDKHDVAKFLLPYDIPLTPYSPEDVPFVMDHLEYYVQSLTRK